MGTPMPVVRIAYYSDVLCIWAYVAQARLEQVVRQFGDQIAIDTHYCSVFPDAWAKIEDVWKTRGGFAGFNRHLLDVAEKFPHITVHPRLWLDVRPRTSASAHLFLKAVEVIDQENAAGGSKKPYLERPAARAAWAMRRAFFEFGKDVSDWHVHRTVTDELGLDYDQIDARIRSSEAMARLAADYQLSEKNHIEGSPTFVLNEGRQKLFGNVGYRLIETNIQELLRSPATGEASWC
jgi:predicted DsbA family dithiol-disulfide isomerase